MTEHTSRQEAKKLASEVRVLKHKAKDAYLEHARLMRGRSDGANLAAHISPPIAVAAHLYNHTMKRLKEIDPSFPKDFQPLPEGE